MKEIYKNLISILIVCGFVCGMIGLNCCRNSTDSKSVVKLDPFKEHIKKEAERMSNYLLTKEYKSFIKCMYPPLIEKMGGEDQMLSILEKGLPDGNSIEKVSISIPSDTILVQNQIQCTLKEDIVMKVKGGKLLYTSTLIGLSDDNGKTWFFLDANGRSLQSLKEGFPNLSDQLNIIISSKPTFISE